jgi:hypothetical protein
MLESDVNGESAQVDAKDRRGLVWRILCVLAIALAVRYWCTVGQSITFDEYYELMLAQEDASSILNRADGFPPAFAFVLKSWYWVFGVGSGRVLSIALGLVACLGMWGAGAEVGGRRLGFWASFVTAILPIHAFYTSESRAYSLLLALSSFVVWFGFRMIRGGRWFDCFMFGCLAVLGHYTHYLFVLFVGLILCVGWLQGFRWRFFLTGVGIAVATLPLVFFCMPQDFAMQQGLPYQVGFGLGELAFTYGSFFTGFSLGPSLRELHELTAKDALWKISPWASAIGLSVVVIILCSWRKVRSGGRELVLLVVLCAGPLFMGMMCLAFKLSYHPRYVIWTIVPVVLLGSWLAMCASAYRLGRFGIAGLLICFGAALWNRCRVDEYRNEDLSAVSGLILGDSSKQRPVVVVSGYMVEPLRYYLGAGWDLLGVPMESAYEDREVEFAKVLDRVRESGGDAWFLYTREFHEDPDGALFAKLRDVARVNEVGEEAGIKVYSIKMESKN